MNHSPTRACPLGCPFLRHAPFAALAAAAPQLRQLDIGEAGSACYLLLAESTSAVFTHLTKLVTAGDAFYDCDLLGGRPRRPLQDMSTVAPALRVLCLADQHIMPLDLSPLAGSRTVEELEVTYAHGVTDNHKECSASLWAGLRMLPQLTRLKIPGHALMFRDFKAQPMALPALTDLTISPVVMPLHRVLPLLAPLAGSLERLTLLNCLEPDRWAAAPAEPSLSHLPHLTRLKALTLSISTYNYDLSTEAAVEALAPLAQAALRPPVLAELTLLPTWAGSESRSADIDAVAAWARELRARLAHLPPGLLVIKETAA